MLNFHILPLQADRERDDAWRKNFWEVEAAVAAAADIVLVWQNIVRWWCRNNRLIHQNFHLLTLHHSETDEDTTRTRRSCTPFLFMTSLSQHIHLLIKQDGFVRQTSFKEIGDEVYQKWRVYDRVINVIHECVSSGQASRVSRNSLCSPNDDRAQWHLLLSREMNEPWTMTSHSPNMIWYWYGILSAQQ